MVFVVTDNTSLDTAFDAGVLADTIRFDAAGPYALSKDLTCLAGTVFSDVAGNVAITSGAFSFLIPKQAGVVSWTGNFNVTSTSAHVFHLGASGSGALTANMTGVIAHGATGTNSGFKIDGVTFNGTSCEAYDNFDGFSCLNGAVMNLTNCIGRVNADEGATGHDTCVVNLINGTYADNAENQIGNGPGANFLTVDGATITHPVGASGQCVLSSAGNTVVVRHCLIATAKSDLRGTVTIVAAGADGATLIHGCVVTSTGTNGTLFRHNGGGRTLDIWDCEFTWDADPALVSDVSVFMHSTGDTTIRRCRFDFTTWATVAVGDKFIYQVAAGELNMEGNLLLGPHPSVTEDAVYIVEAIFGAGSINHNTFVTGVTDACRAIYVRVDGNSIRGNIIEGGFNIGIRADAESNYTGTYNCVHGTTDAFFTAVAGTGDIETDPLLDASYVPQAPAVQEVDAVDSYQLDAHVLTLGPNIARAPTADRTTASKTTALSDMGCFNRTIIITASGPATFTGWAGDASGTVNPLTVDMTADKAITANFDTAESFGPTTLTSGDAGDDNTALALASTTVYSNLSIHNAGSTNACGFRTNPDDTYRRIPAGGSRVLNDVHVEDAIEITRISGDGQPENISGHVW